MPRLCCRIAGGFALAEEEVLNVMADRVARCDPPWSQKELRDKISRAWKYGREPVGRLLR